MDLLENFAINAVIFMVGALSLVLLLLIILTWRNPVLTKIGLRNIRRRPGQTVLIVVGLTLSTIIIVATFGTGDTLRYSVQRQAVSAYGQVDEIVAPPIFSLLAGLEDGQGSAATAELEETFDNLSAGGLTTVMTLVQGGLPSIDEPDLERLRTEAESEPLIDGLAGSIIFPTIIRNVSSGQSEPLGFIYAVDDQYPQNFGLTAIDGREMEMTALEPGIGNIFLQASNLFSLASQQLERTGVTDYVPEITLAATAISALLTGADIADLPPMVIALDTLAELGVNVEPLREQGIESIDLQEIAASITAATEALREAAQEEGGAQPADAPPIEPAPVAPSSADAVASPDAVATSPASSAGEVQPDTTDAITAISDTVQAGANTDDGAAPAGAIEDGGPPADDVQAGDAPIAADTPAFDLAQVNIPLLNLTGDELLQAINLNTIGYEIDRVLEPFGLQLRQGELYLSRLGAERLDAGPGDLLEVYIGPLPVRFRVKAVVDEAGPLSAVLPVVMLPLEEAQQMLFMNDKVNAILVSNQGDELEGVVHTEAVTQRLRVLAMDQDAVAQVAGILARPDVSELIRDGAVNLPSEPEPVEDLEDEDIPPIIKGLVTSIAEQFIPVGISQQETDALFAALEAPDTDRALREVLANDGVRTWLLGLNLDPATKDELRTALGNLNQFEQIEPLNKSTILTAATVGGSVFASIFSLFGVFSILAAVLLIFLIFVMLAAERRSEIGMARAVGTQRRQVVQMFVTEGMVYDLVAAALGVLLGIGITYAMTQFVERLFNDVTGQVNSQLAGIFSVSFNISWQSVVISYSLGVLLTFLVITVASWRVSEMNIVAAMRDLPDRYMVRRRSWLRGVWRWLFPLLIAAAGGWMLWQAVKLQTLGLTMIAVTLLLIGLMQLLGRVLERTPMRVERADRMVYTIIGLGLLIIWITPWSRLAANAGIKALADLLRYDVSQAPTVFLFGGPLIIIGAIMVIMYNADILARITGALFGFIPAMRPVLKTAIAYPLNARFRTGMTMVLFAMIMATVVVMAVVIDATQNLVELSPESTAGFDIEISETLLSVFSPVDDLEAAFMDQADDPRLSGVESVGRTEQEVLRARVGDGEGGNGWAYAGVSGLNDGYLQQAAEVYELQARAPGYEDDAAVWQALRERDDVVVVMPGGFVAIDGSEQEGRQRRFDGPNHGHDPWKANEFFLPSTDLSSGQLPALTIDLKISDLDSVVADGPIHRVQVIGVLAGDESLAESAIQGNLALLEKVVGAPVTGGQTYVKVAEGADVYEVTAGIEGVFVANGLNAAVLAERFAQAQQLTGGILRLLQGFMALGLLVGIAALGVVSTRSVVERRQQVGMLRAIGYQQRMVGVSFLLESSFISMVGLLIGALTGIVLGMNILNAFFPEIMESAISVPWSTIGGIVLVAYLFSLLTTVIPAWQASRIYPAEALRYE